MVAISVKPGPAAAAGGGEAPPKLSIEDEIERLEGEGRELTPEYMEEIDAALGDKPATAPGGDGAAAAQVHTPQIGGPIEGFDLAVLRSAERVNRLRHPIEKMRASVPGAEPMTVNFSVALEFGRDSGVAEVAAKEELYRAMLQDIVGHMRAEELMTVGGKIRLKEWMARDLNRRLQTARVRQVYLTEFRIVPSR